MRQDELTRAVSTGPALLLLLLVTAGLFTMHTLGHTGPHNPSMHSHAGAVAPSSAHAQPAMTSDRRDQTQAGDESPAKPLPFDSLAVCMAVLATLVLLVIAALLVNRTAGWTMRLTRLVRQAVDMVRGPPGVSIGLMVADLSVARS